MKGRKRQTARGGLIAAMIGCFLSGVAVDWWLRTNGPPLPAAALRRFKDVVDASGSDERLVRPAPADLPSAGEIGPVLKPGGRPTETELDDSLAELRRRDLRVPIDETPLASLKGDFAERRGADRPHEAIDILAPRNTAIHAVEDGTIAKLFVSKAGGNTIYQFDPSRRFAYYYAHIQKYADGLAEGQHVSRGDVIAYVGTSGNAPPGTPHLHFAIFVLTPERAWWKGSAVDPYLVFGG